MAPNVRVLAVTFLDVASARAAAAMLVRIFSPIGAVRLAPLGRASYPSKPGTLLTARFSDDVVGAVRDAVEAAGGTVEMDVPEDSTH